jgi:L-threonylcarbamoyladenylate synthase
VNLVLDAGMLPGGRGSTVVDVTTDPIQILREGNIPAARLLRLLQSAGINIAR